MAGSAVGVICLGNRPGGVASQAGVVFYIQVLIVSQHLRGKTVVVTLIAAGCHRLAGLGSGVTLTAGGGFGVGFGLMAPEAVITVNFFQVGVVEIIGRDTLIVARDTGGRLGC